MNCAQDGLWEKHTGKHVSVSQKITCLIVDSTLSTLLCHTAHSKILPHFFSHIKKGLNYFHKHFIVFKLQLITQILPYMLFPMPLIGFHIPLRQILHDSQFSSKGLIPKSKVKRKDHYKEHLQLVLVNLHLNFSFCLKMYQKTH